MTDSHPLEQAFEAWLDMYRMERAVAGGCTLRAGMEYYPEDFREEEARKAEAALRRADSAARQAAKLLMIMTAAGFTPQSRRTPEYGYNG